jgi:hypothetical protein
MVLFIKILRKNKQFRPQNENNLKIQAETISIENGENNNTIDKTLEESTEVSGTFSF